MSQELLAELSEEELAAPDFYPIEYALTWVAYGNKPINPDYAKIIYGNPPKVISNDKLESAEKKLMTYLRSGKISAKTSEYESDEKGKHVRTGEHVPLEREAWKGDFDWFDLTLNYCDSEGVYYECTEIIVNTEELLKCKPVEVDNPSKKANDNKSRDTKPVMARERTAYLNIIGALLGTLLGKSSNGNPYSQFESQQSVIDSIYANFGNKFGLSKRNLEAKFAEAQKSLKNSIEDQ